MRRTLVALTARAVLLVVTATGAAGDERPVVNTLNGRISGFMELSTKGKPLYSFHSIPYAKPPIGNLRLKDPEAAGSWSGVRDGSVVPPLCSQIPYMALTNRKPVYDGKEDCLYLSIFTAKPGEPNAQLPVMVFFHGGAYYAGGIRNYTPYVLLNEDIVLVLVQYRLGILGFLSTEDSVIPGNFGLKDQTMALKWIQRNIHNFGGDPKRVTLFGESAGGSSVHFHILSPHSEGLFARGIMQSGTLFCPWAMGGSFSEVARYTGELFGCPQPHGTSSDHASSVLLSCLQGVNVENLTLSLMHHVEFNFSPLLLGPRVDGDFIPSEPELLMVQGKHKVVDIISGVNSHEGGLFAFPLYSNEALQTDLLGNFTKFGPASLDILEDNMPLEVSKTIFDYYVGGIKAGLEDADNICKMYGDRHFNIAHDLTAIVYAKNVGRQKKIFLYELNHRGQRSFGDYYNTNIGQHWVDHVDDLFYLFTGENTLWKPLENEDDLRLREIMVRMWTNFAATGNPTPDDSLGFTWEPAVADNLHHLSLTPTPSMKADHRQEVRAFWNTLNIKQTYLLHEYPIILHNSSSSIGPVTVEFSNHDSSEVHTGESYNHKSNEWHTGGKFSPRWHCSPAWDVDWLVFNCLPTW
ncbi:carboxylic ester hydrolase isoform X2 [Procambarus clarkii]|uniref:carboxylic ester hydrolase isoform X2 n=1 Tax=Procambarus clarkii TaxID=6728 RepID=UPI003742FC50